MANKDKVVGVFLDQGQARQVVQTLKGQGLNAQIADKSALKAFREAGWEDEVIRLYESRMNEGNSIVTVSGGDGGRVLDTMLQAGAEYINLHEGGQSGQTKGAQAGMKDAAYYQNLNANQREYGQVNAEKGRRHTAEEAKKIQLRQENLTAVKENVQMGEVELRKVVHERQQEVPVNLTREEVYVERHAVNRPATPGEITDMQDEVISVPVYEEQAELQKHARVVEEVNIGKQAVQEQKTLSGTTKHEHVEVVQSGDVQVHDDAGTETQARTEQGGVPPSDTKKTR